MLLVTLSEGDYIMIGENIKVHFDHKAGRDTLALGIEAPKEVSILRGKLYEEGIAKMADEGDVEAQKLSRKLKKEYEDRRKKSYIRKARRENQERRMAAGEIKPYNAEAVGG